MTTPITPSEPKCATCGHDEPHTSSAMVRVNTICSATGCWCRSFTPAEPPVDRSGEPRCIRLVHDMAVTSSCDLPANAPVHLRADDEGGHPFETRSGEQSARERARRLMLDLLKGCGDNSCRFLKPKGMATNGGCRCIDKIEDALGGTQ